MDLEYSIFVSTFHVTRLVISNWKIPSLSTFFDSLTKEQDKLIHMGVLNYSKGKDHSLMVQGSKNVKTKEKQIVKKPKSEIEDEDSYEDLMNKVKKKGRKYKLYYCSKGFHSNKKYFNKNMDIMSQLLENHNIEVPYEPEKPVDFSEHCHRAQFEGDINYDFSYKVKSFPHISDIS